MPAAPVRSSSAPRTTSLSMSLSGSARVSALRSRSDTNSTPTKCTNSIAIKSVDFSNQIWARVESCSQSWEVLRARTRILVPVVDITSSVLSRIGSCTRREKRARSGVSCGRAIAMWEWTKQTKSTARAICAPARGGHGWGRAVPAMLSVDARRGTAASSEPGSKRCIVWAEGTIGYGNVGAPDWDAV